MSAEYDEAAVQRLLAEDSGIAELGIEAHCREGVLVLMGAVESPQRRAEIERRVADLIPHTAVRNDIAVTRTQAPTDAEELT